MFWRFTSLCIPKATSWPTGHDAEREETDSATSPMQLLQLMFSWGNFSMHGACRSAQVELEKSLPGGSSGLLLYMSKERIGKTYLNDPSLV
jgi:hypothetical protein